MGSQSRSYTLIHLYAGQNLIPNGEKSLQANIRDREFEDVPSRGSWVCVLLLKVNVASYISKSAYGIKCSLLVDRARAMNMIVVGYLYE